MRRCSDDGRNRVTGYHKWFIFYVLELNYKKLIGGFERMEYQNNYVAEKRSVIFSIAICIRRRFSYRIGTVLLNVFC